jgi:hypothetical protein
VDRKFFLEKMEGQGGGEAQRVAGQKNNNKNIFFFSNVIDSNLSDGDHRLDPDEPLLLVDEHDVGHVNWNPDKYV